MKKGSGIRTRFIVILVLSSMIPLLITGYILTKINEQSIKLQIKEFQLSISVQLTDLTHSILDNSCRELNEITTLLNDTNLSSDNVIRLTTYKLTNSKAISYLNIHDREGAYIDSIVPVGEDIKKFVSGKIPSDIRDQISDSTCIPGKFFTHKGKIFLSIFKTWKSGTELQGYFQAITEITGLSARLDKMIHERSYPRFDKAYILDRDFNIIADSNVSKGKGNREIGDKKMLYDIFGQRTLPSRNIGLAFDHKVNGTEWLVNINTISRFNWMVVTLQKKKTAYESLYSMQKKIILIALAFALLAILTGAITGRLLSSPILKIANGARILAKKDFKHRIKGIRSKDEIGEVADAFNFLGESLEIYDSRIKKEVAIRSDLSRYLSPELVESVIERKADLSLGGRKEKVAVLFADIAGFTSIAESHEPEKIVSLLNELFTILTGIIFRNNGMIDKFIGDSVMALFGIPGSSPDAADQAVKTAKEMITWLEVGNKKWKKEFGVKIELSISINYGDAIVGNIGSEKRMEFTAIGDVVNTAAKVEKIALGNQILITEEVYNALTGSVKAKPKGMFKLPGHEENLKLFEVINS